MLPCLLAQRFVLLSGPVSAAVGLRFVRQSCCRCKCALATARALARPSLRLLLTCTIPPSNLQAPTHLPHCVWHQISLLIYGLDTAPAAVLAQRAALMLTCREVAAAARGVPLRLDLRGATDVAVVKALLSAAPVSHLWLRPDMGADDVLRAPAVRALSCTSLVELSANISCTDTLQAFPNLRQLHLQVSS